MPNVVGHISQIIGPVVDVHFDLTQAEEKNELPNIHDALTITRTDGKKLIVEVQQHIGEDTVRAVAMDSTDGLQRGMEAVSTSHPIEMPVGPQIRGRVLNVVGESIDGLGELDRAHDCLSTGNPLNSKTSPHHRKSSTQESKSLTFSNLT